jgi:hypothetical protein
MRDLANKIASKLSSEGITADNYTKEAAKKALSGCAASDKLIGFLLAYECDVLVMLRVYYNG